MVTGLVTSLGAVSSVGSYLILFHPHSEDSKQIALQINMDKREFLEKAGRNCPVRLSLDPSINIVEEYIWL